MVVMGTSLVTSDAETRLKTWAAWLPAKDSDEASWDGRRTWVGFCKLAYSLIFIDLCIFNETFDNFSKFLRIKNYYSTLNDTYGYFRSSSTCMTSRQSTHTHTRYCYRPNLSGWLVVCWASRLLMKRVCGESERGVRWTWVNRTTRLPATQHSSVKLLYPY